jgi:4-hydroxy-2-oxoheptanedioate aldolase
VKLARLESLKSAASPKLGMVVMYSSPGVIERIGPDWDFIWIDGQHGEIGEDQMRNLVRACDLIQRPALARVSGHDYGTIGKVLDMGAAGVIVPGVDNAEQARAIVAAAKFPPLGNRSYGGRRVIDLQGRTYSNSANDEVLCIVQIESPDAIANANQIAAVPGVDVLFLGHDDLLIRRGVGVEAPRNIDSLGAAMQVIADACKNHGKSAMVVGVDSDMVKAAVQMGFRLIVAGGDVSFLASGSKTASMKAKEAITEYFAEQSISRNQHEALNGDAHQQGHDRITNSYNSNYH